MKHDYVKVELESDPLLPHPVPSSPQTSPNDLRGFLMMVYSVAGLSGMIMAVRISEIRYGFPPLACVVVRALSQMGAIILPLAFSPKMREAARFSQDQFRVLVLRGVAGSLGMLFLYLSLAMLPVGNASSIFATCPIITIFLAYFVLGEAIGPYEIVCAAVGFVGMLLVAQPSTDGFNSQRLLGSALVLIGTVCASIAYVCVRAMGMSVYFLTSIFSLNIFSLFFGLLFGGWNAILPIFTNTNGTLLMIVGGLSGFFGQCCMTKGFQMSKAGQGVIVRTLDVPVLYALGMLFLNEKPDLLGVVGSVLTVASAVALGARTLVRASF